MPPAKAREASSPPNETTPSPPNATLTPPPKDKKITHTQQIRALEAEMEEEECAQYLDDRDMGEDFWSAGA